MKANTQVRIKQEGSPTEEVIAEDVKEVRIELTSGEMISLTGRAELDALRELIKQKIFERNGAILDITPAFYNEISSWNYFNESYLTKQGEETYFAEKLPKEIISQGIDCALRMYRVDSRTRALAKEIGLLIMFKEIKLIRWGESNGQ